MTEIHSAKLPNIIRTAIKKLKRAGVDMIATFHRDTCSVGRIFFTCSFKTEVQKHQCLKHILLTPSGGGGPAAGAA
jgi:hypothetical protein